ncbi:hypothetical protein MMC09_002108 [Bachmanniomyces sp. S44760]|nr:hypothetical protein [Bachmanniomyces sp. S44760]
MQEAVQSLFSHTLNYDKHWEPASEQRQRPKVQASSGLWQLILGSVDRSRYSRTSRYYNCRRNILLAPNLRRNQRIGVNTRKFSGAESGDTKNAAHGAQGATTWGGLTPAEGSPATKIVAQVVGAIALDVVNLHNERG